MDKNHKYDGARLPRGEPDRCNAYETSTRAREPTMFVSARSRTKPVAAGNVPYYIIEATHTDLTDMALLMEPEQPVSLFRTLIVKFLLKNRWLVCPPWLDPRRAASRFVYFDWIGFCKELVTFVISGDSA